MARSASKSLAWYEARKWPPTPTFAELNPQMFAGQSDQAAKQSAPRNRYNRKR